ncbi:hypothetical protein [Benzoatithermus flavus]|uniref:Uncharacterized protein n=1 Tax=Benzoatithermus flavus TaxID=3108223 RepID=A0ABU8XVV6_9PROT
MLNEHASSRARVMTGSALMLGLLAFAGAPAEAASTFSFPMVRANGLDAGCAPRAAAYVTIRSLGFAERMTVTVRGLPPGTALDLFTIQAADFPFGIGWYVGDLEVGRDGTVTKSFVGRFNVETFALGAGQRPVPAPTHAGDARGRNPAFAPIHTYHLGIWFNSPADAARAGGTCPANVTPFNGEHSAGVQVLSTRNFVAAGPLQRVD